MTDFYQPYHDLLDGKPVEISADNPFPGRYKMRRNGAFVAVLINVDAEGVLRAKIGANSIVDPLEIWTSCAKNPIRKEDYDCYIATGSFPGDAPAPIGDNSGDLSLAEQIKDYATQALNWLKKNGIKDKASRDLAANYRQELLRLEKEADTQRVAEKKPHDEAAKAVQAKWKPIIDEAALAAETLRSELGAYMIAEKRAAEAEARAKYEAEQKAAAAARAEIEAQRKKLERDDPIAFHTSPEPELPMAPLPPEPVKIQAGGQRGRKTGLREVTRYVVTDHGLALAFFAQSDEVKELIGKLAERASKAGVAVPGVEKRIEEVAA